MDWKVFHRRQQYDPCRAIDHPWQTIRQCVDDAHDLTRRRDPPQMREATAFLQALRSGHDEPSRESVRKRWPDLWAAYQLSRNASALRWEIEARILTGQSDEAIADCCATTAATVRRYEALFFHVRDRLQAHDWIISEAIGSRIVSHLAQNDLGTLWRAFAYFGGVDVLEVVIPVSQDRELPASVDELAPTDPSFNKQRLRLSCRLAINAMRLPFEAQPFPLFKLHLIVVDRELARSAEVRKPESFADRVQRIIEEEKPQKPQEVHQPVVNPVVA